MMQILAADAISLIFQQTMCCVQPRTEVKLIASGLSYDINATASLTPSQSGIPPQLLVL